MSSTHDFRIEQQEFVKALAEYNNMKNTLQEVERELIDRKSNGLTHMGQSNAITDYSQDLTNFLSDGEYRHAYNLITGMQDFLEDILPVINYLCVRCEEFPLQLKQNEYKDVIAPAAGNNTARNGGILSITYQRVSNVMDECEEVLTKVDEVEKGLLSIASDCDDIAGLGSEIQAITDAAQKLRRIGNYAVSLSAYKSGIEALETEMEVRFNALVALNKQSLGSYEARDNDYIIEEQEKIDILGMCADNDINSIEDMMKTNPESVTEILNDILKKPANEWSNSEAEYVANVFNYGIEEKQPDIVELCLNGMVYDAYVNKRTEFGKKDCPAIYYADYCVQADVNKINAVLEKLEQGEAADTLNRVSKLELYTEVSSLGNVEDMGNYNLEVSLSEVGQIIISNKIFDNPNEDYFYENSWTITSCEVAEVVSAEGIRRLEREGFTEEEIDAMLSNVVTEEDIVFFAHLANGEYEEAFDKDPDLISDNMACVLVDYLTHFHEKYEGKGSALELKKIVNGIMKVDEKNCYCINNTSGGFLDIIQATLLNNMEVANVTVLDVNTSNSEREEAFRDSEIYYNQYGFWAAMDKLYELDMGINDLTGVDYQNNGRNGYIRSELVDLEINNMGGYSCSVKLIGYDMEGVEKYVLGDDFISVKTSTVWGCDLAQLNSITEIKELDKKRKDLFWETGYDYLFGLGGDAGSAVGDVIKALVNMDLGGFIDAQSGLPYGDAFESYTEDDEVINSNISSIIAAACEYQQITNDMENINEELRKLIFGQSIKVEFNLNYYGEDGYSTAYDDENCLGQFQVGSDIHLSKSIYRQELISEKGILGYLNEMGYSKEESGEIIDNIRKNTSLQESQLHLLYGDDGEIKWYDNEAGVTSDAIMDIDNFFDTYKAEDGTYPYKHFDLAAWLRGE